LGGIGRSDFFGGRGTTIKGFFLGGMGGRSLVLSQDTKVEVFMVFKELFFW